MTTSGKKSRRFIESDNWDLERVIERIDVVKVIIERFFK